MAERSWRPGLGGIHGGERGLTCLVKDDKEWVEIGSGIVADSVPLYEYNETVNKAAAMMRAVGLAKTLAPKV